MARILAGTAAGLHEIDPPHGVTGEPIFAGSDVGALAVDRTEIWTIIDGREVHRRHEGIWSSAAEIPHARGTCILAARHGVLVGTAGAHLMHLVDGPVFVDAFEHVEGRSDWYTPWGGPPDVRSLSEDRSGALYVNVHVGGIPSSRDGGATFEPTIDIHADVHQVLADSEREGVVLAATARGLAVSRTHGSRWEFRERGLHASYMRAVASDGDLVFASASEGPGGRRSALYRTSLAADAELDRCRGGLPEWFSSNIDTASLVAGGGLAAFGTHGGSVWVSGDEGEHWTEVASDLPPVRCLAIA